MARFAASAWMVFVLFGALAFLFGVFPGPWFDEDNELTRDAQWLISTYAAVAVALTIAIALTAFRRGERWAWLVCWAWPVFFVVHGVLFFLGPSSSRRSASPLSLSRLPAPVVRRPAEPKREGRRRPPLTRSH